MTIAYRLLPDGSGYVDETGVHRGSPPSQEDYLRVELAFAHRTLFSGPVIHDFKEVEEEFGGPPTPYDPLNPQHNPELPDSPFHEVHELLKKRE